jgi:hypothetical protein
LEQPQTTTTTKGSLFINSLVCDLSHLPSS